MSHRDQRHALALAEHTARFIANGWRGRCAGGGRRGAGALHAGVHIRFVVIADVEHIVVALKHAREAAEPDVEFADSVFSVSGTDRRLGIEEVARAAFNPMQQAPGVEPGFAETGNYLPPQPTFPNGCHVCEVEIEPETGHIEIVRYLVVDDFGTVINPLLLRGQVQGGVAQGVGQAMLERTVFDPTSGQLLTGSLTDYCLPRADDLPAIEFAYNVVPCRTNPLGVKGAGEAGAIGAPPALVNAVVDALGELGVEHLDMPLTPERLWAAIRAATARKAA